MCAGNGLVVYLWLRSKTSLAPYWGLSRWKRTWWSRIELSWNRASTPMLHFDHWVSTCFSSSKFFCFFFKNILETRFILKIALACRYIAFKFRGFRRTTPRVHSYRFFWTVRSSQSNVIDVTVDVYCSSQRTLQVLCALNGQSIFPFFFFWPSHVERNGLTRRRRSSQSVSCGRRRIFFQGAIMPRLIGCHLPELCTRTSVEGRQKPIVIEFDRSSVDGQFHFASAPFFPHCFLFLRTRLSLHQNWVIEQHNFTVFCFISLLHRKYFRCIVYVYCSTLRFTSLLDVWSNSLALFFVGETGQLKPTVMAGPRSLQRDQ